MHKQETKITQRETKLVARLKELDSSHVKFFDAKKLLLEEGYGEKEIAKCLYIFSYDGIPNKPKKEDPVTKYYTQNPEESERVAQYILERRKDGQLGRKVAYALAARYAPGPHARSYYALRFADEIDFPMFTGIFASVVSVLAVIRWDLSPIFVYAGFAFVLVYWLLKRYILNR